MSIWNSLKKHFSMAWKTVLHGKREYAGFFAAILLVQVMLGVSTVAYCNNNRIEKAAAAGEYEYHFVLENLTSSQFYYISNVQASEQEKDWLFDMGYKERVLSSGGSRYDVFVTLRGDPDKSFSAFTERYGAALAEERDYALTKTPLLEYAERLAGSRATFTAILILCMVLSWLLLTVLYRIRIDHYKFNYGVYLSFGADYKTLLRMSVCEMLVITGLTALPALLLSYLVSLFLYLGKGGLRGFYILPLLTLLLGSAVVALCAVLLPVLVLSRGRPSRLLIAEDNSNFASSPRHSAFITKKKMPRGIELLTIRRFRRYYAGLLLAASAFGMLLVAGNFLADCYRQNKDMPQAEYTVDFSGSRYTAEDAAEALQKLEGVAAVTRETGISAANLDFNLLIPAEKAVRGFTAYPRDHAYAGSMMVRFEPADALSLSLLTDFYGYEVEGDASLLTQKSGYVVVFDTVDNRRAVRLAPGDKIFLTSECRVYGLIRTEGEQFGMTVTLEENDLLRSYFDACDFNYRAYTVAAVVSGAPAGDELTIQLNAADYTALTGAKATTRSAEIYLEKGITAEQAAKVDGALTALQDSYPGIKVEQSGASETKQTDAKKNYYGLFTAISMILFAVCPIIWLFSQILFYGKRELEMDIFRSVGSTLGEIRGLYRTDGLVLAILAGALYSLLSWGAVQLCGAVINRSWFQILAFREAGKYRYTAHLPLGAYLAGLVLTMLFAYAASELSWRLYQKKATEHISGVFAED